MLEPPDISGGSKEPPEPPCLVPPAAVFVTVASNESGMDTDGSYTTLSSRPLKTSRARRVCKQCNKHKKKGHSSAHKSSDCQCSDNEINENSTSHSSVPQNQFVAPHNPQQKQPENVVASQADATVFIPVGRKLYDETDSAPYVVHVQKEQSDLNDGTIFHPIAFGRFLKKHCVQNIVNGSLKRIGRNRMCLSFTKHSDANLFLSHKSLTENKLKAFIPTFNVTRMGLVRGVPTEWSPEEVIDNINVPIGCGKILKARRLNYKVQVEGSPVWKPSQTVVLTIDGQVLPKRIFMCYNSLPVELYIFPTIQCFNCCRFGHTKAQCRSSPKCFRCGQGHSGLTCKVEEEFITCCMCHGSHTAIDKTCPEFIRQKNIKQTMADSCISYPEASKLHPPISKSYAEMARSLFHKSEPKSVNHNYNPQNPGTSYIKTYFKKPRAPYISPKGYDKTAHNEITKGYNTPLSAPNGSAFAKSANIDEQSIAEIISVLLQTLTEHNIMIPSNAAPLIKAFNLKINNNGPIPQSYPSVELPQCSQ